VTGANGTANGKNGHGKVTAMNGRSLDGFAHSRGWNVEIHLDSNHVVSELAHAKSSREAVEAALAKNGIHPFQVSGIAATPFWA
jgi:hypothetical protein